MGPSTVVWISFLAALGKRQFGNRLYHHRVNCLQQKPGLSIIAIKINLPSPELTTLCIQKKRSISYGMTTAMVKKTSIIVRKLNFQNSLSKMFFLPCLPCNRKFQYFFFSTNKHSFY